VNVKQKVKIDKVVLVQNVQYPNYLLF